MSLQLVAAPSLQGEAGLQQLRALQQAMADALAESDFCRVRQLDATCATVLSKLMDVNRDNRPLLVDALSDLKAVYTNLIHACEVQAKAACV